MDVKQLAISIIEGMGGTQNITKSWHCITRLRFNVKDSKLINLEAIKQLDGVMGAQFQSGQFQVIIGSQVVDVHEEISKILNESGSIDTNIQSDNHSNLLDKIFDVISGIFTPILAAITGSGLLKGIIAILLWLNILQETSDTYLVLNAISDATFYFLPFLIAFSAAKKFDTNVSLAIALSGILMYPGLFNLFSEQNITGVKFMGYLTIPLNNYSSSVLPIILGVWLMSYIEKYIQKIVPKTLTIIFVPLLTLIITAPIVLAFIAPLGTFIGSYLERFFSTLFTVAGPLAGALLGGLMPLIIITGMHYAFFPSTFASLEKLGYDIVLLPLNLVANVAQAGSTLGVFIKTKDSNMKQLAISSFIPALFGITEPAIYGVTMKLKKPFYISMLGGACGGALYGTFIVKSFGFAVPGLLSLPTYIEKGSYNFLWAILGVLISFSVGLIGTLIVSLEHEQGDMLDEQVILPEINKNDDKLISIYSPITGTLKKLKECPDEIFASEIVGKGVGIIPDEKYVYAPFNGTVTMITPTKHAIGLVSNEGVEVLIHVGIDTVSLDGDGFEYFVKEGDAVNTGEKLMEFDKDIILNNNLSLFTPIIITNTSHYLDVVIKQVSGEIQHNNQELLLVVSDN